MINTGEPHPSYVYTNLLKYNDARVRPTGQSIPLPGSDVPQLALALPAANDDLVEVSARVGHTRHFKRVFTKLKLTIQHYRIHGTKYIV